MSKELDELAGFAFYAIGSVCLFVAASFALMIGWNWSAADLFAMPTASYRNAAGAAVLLCVVRVLLKNGG